MKHATFKPTTLEPWNVGKKRHGRPKAQWGQTTQRAYWDIIRTNLTSEHRNQEWNNTPEKRRQLVETARAKQAAKLDRTQRKEMSSENAVQVAPREPTVEEYWN